MCHTASAPTTRRALAAKQCSAARQPGKGQCSHAPCAICIAWCPFTLRVAMAPLPRSAVTLKEMSLAVMNSLPFCKAAGCGRQVGRISALVAGSLSGQAAHAQRLLHNRSAALPIGQATGKGSCERCNAVKIAHHEDAVGCINDIDLQRASRGQRVKHRLKEVSTVTHADQKPHTGCGQAWRGVAPAAVHTQPSSSASNSRCEPSS